MSGSRARIVPLLIIGAAGAVAVGIATVADRIADARLDRTPAAPGTPQLNSRLPIALWPSDGSEPIVERGVDGWRRMLATLYHRDTTVDDAARARAIVISELPRREQDSRRQTALEAHVLVGVYEPELVATGWLHPLRGIRREDLVAIGVTAPTLSALDAMAALDADPELALRWRRELGIDNVRPEITSAIIADTPADRRGMLWAMTLDLAGQRILAR